MLRIACPRCSPLLPIVFVGIVLSGLGGAASGHAQSADALPAKALPAKQGRAQKWVWPLDPRPEVIRGFQPPATPWGAGHRGVDLAAKASHHVRSAGDGVVSFAGVIAGRGVVTITHGALRTTYEPVTSTLQLDTPVAAGQQIGQLADSSGHCAPQPCLHWGLLRGQEYLNPLGLLRSGRSRLLPVWGLPAPQAAPAKFPASVHSTSGEPSQADATRPPRISSLALVHGGAGGAIGIVVALAGSVYLYQWRAKRQCRQDLP